jgi:hypothetical protein
MILTHYKQQDEHSHMCSHAAHSIAVVHAALGSCISDKQQQTQTVGCEEAREEGCPLARGARHRWGWLAASGRCFNTACAYLSAQMADSPCPTVAVRYMASRSVDVIICICTMQIKKIAAAELALVIGCTTVRPAAGSAVCHGCNTAPLVVDALRCSMAWCKCSYGDIIAHVIVPGTGITATRTRLVSA